jgi:hypothetical protein
MNATVPSQTAPVSWRRPDGRLHRRALSLYMLIVFGHWAEHIAQAYQLFILGWARPQSGGVLGLWFPELAASEVLHFVYNLSLLAGLALLAPGFRGHARTGWLVATALQGWHFFEHFLLQVQWLTGFYLFGAAQQTSILQLWIPRIELHLFYNTLVFLPMLAAMILYSRAHRKRQ